MTSKEKTMEQKEFELKQKTLTVEQKTLAVEQKNAEINHKNLLINSRDLVRNHKSFELDKKRFELEKKQFEILLKEDCRSDALLEIEKKNLEISIKNQERDIQERIITHICEYGVDFTNRIITIGSDIDDAAFNEFNTSLTCLEALSNDPITVRLISYGGEVYAAIGIVGRIRSSKCKIITEGYGKIMSAATLILAAGNIRKISKYSHFMHHESAYDYTGRQSQHKHQLKVMEMFDDRWCLWMQEFTKKDKEFWKNTGIHEDEYYFPEDLIAMGVADEIF